MRYSIYQAESRLGELTFHKEKPIFHGNEQLRPYRNTAYISSQLGSGIKGVFDLPNASSITPFMLLQILTN